MAIFDFFLSRNGAASTPANYIGHRDRLFYESSTGELRISDGSTPGGLPIPITLASSDYPGSVKPGLGFTIGENGLLSLNAGPMFELDVNDVFQLKAGTSTRIGGVKSGNGIIIASDGTINLDTEGLSFAFGDFYAFINEGPSNGTCLSSVNENQDINIVTNGTGTINVVGEFHVHKTNENLEGALTVDPIFSVNSEGKIRVLAPNTGGTDGAVEIIGNISGTIVAPNQTGVVTHITGNPNMVSRNYIDGVNSYPLIAGRRYNGTASTATNVLNGELFFRIAGQASTGAGFETFGPCQIDWVATEDQGPDNQGGEIRVRATPNGSSAVAGIVQVAAFNATTGVTATRFNGPLIGNVNATSVTATNITVTGNITGNVTATNITASSLIVGDTIRYDVTQHNSTATQLTSKATTVVCNGRTGQIVTSASSLAKGSAITFTVTNNAITAVTDVPVVAIQSGATADSYSISVTSVQVGSFNITLTNNGAGALTDTLIINFAIIKVS